MNCGRDSYFLNKTVSSCYDTSATEWRQDILGDAIVNGSADPMGIHSPIAFTSCSPAFVRTHSQSVIFTEAPSLGGTSSNCELSYPYFTVLEKTSRVTDRVTDSDVTYPLSPPPLCQAPVEAPLHEQMPFTEGLVYTSSMEDSGDCSLLFDENTAVFDTALTNDGTNFLNDEDCDMLYKEEVPTYNTPTASERANILKEESSPRQSRSRQKKRQGANLTEDERKERNRGYSANYRKKQASEKEMRKTELDRVKKENMSLRAQLNNTNETVFSLQQELEKARAIATALMTERQNTHRSIERRDSTTNHSHSSVQDRSSETKV